MYTILYVDDEPGLLEIGKLFLEHSGEFSVDTVTSAPAALTLMNPKNYDAIIADYQMPGMNGIEFLKKVRSSGNTIPFILFSGRGREEVVIQALNEGADFYLQKGGDPKAQFVELTHKIQIAIEHHRNAEKIQSLNRLYSVISAINRAIVHLRTKDEFFSEIFRILVETGGFRMVWIGLVDEEHKIIRPVASGGYVDGYLDTVNISTENIPRGRGAIGTAYREGKKYICNDISCDPRMEPWREDALKRGYQGIAAFPFALGTKNVGVLALYAPFTGFFGDQIVTLLDELARDITFALRTIDDHNDRIAAECALQGSEAKFRGIFDTINDGIHIHEVAPDGTPGKFIEVNEVACRMVQYTREEMLEHGPLDFVTGFHSRPFPDIISELSTDGHAIFETEHRRKDGTVFPVEVNTHRVFLQGKPAMVAVIRDITGRNETEKTLRESESILRKSEAHLKRAEEIGRSGSWEFWLNENTFDGSDGAKRLYGLDGSAWTREIVQKIPLPEYRHFMDNALKDLIAGKSPYNIEFRIRRPSDGAVLDIHSVAEYDPGRNVVFGVIHDTTDRKRAQQELIKKNEELRASYEQITATEEELRSNLNELINKEVDLRESEEKYRLIVENTRDIIYTLSADGEITFISPSSMSLLGYSPTDLIGLPFLSLIHPDDCLAVQDVFRRSITHNYKSHGTEFRIRHATGEWRWHMSRGNTVKDSSGNILYFTGSTHDVTERKNAEAALKESEEKFRSLVKYALEGIVILDFEGKILFANDASIHLVESDDPAGVVGKNVMEFVAPESQEAVIQDFKNGAMGHDAYLANYTIISVKGKKIYLESIGKVIMYEGKPAALLSIRDITERRLVEDALQQANRKLNLLSGITRHDINNQIMILRSYLTFLEMKQPASTLHEYLQKAKIAAESISASIAFAKDYESVGINAPVWQDCRDLIDKAAMLASPGTIIVKNEIPSGAEVLADPLIVKVFFNLIDNAVRYGGKISTLKFSMEKSHENFVIICEDDGNGVPADEKIKIFERGFGKNTGLGLTISREILEITGITIQELGEPGAGARFEMTVPKAAYRLVDHR